MRTDRWTDMTNLIVTFRNYVNATKKEKASNKERNRMEGDSALLWNFTQG
jgi:hypothetical protein